MTALGVVRNTPEWVLLVQASTGTTERRRSQSHSSTNRVEKELRLDIEKGDGKSHSRAFLNYTGVVESVDHEKGKITAL